MLALAVEHVGVLHAPLEHVAPLAQALPQPPQLRVSVKVFTQALLHTLVPAGAVVGPHVPVARPVFAELHAWQESLQVPLQQTPSVEHDPVTHSASAAQVVPVAFLGVQVVPAQ